MVVKGKSPIKWSNDLIDLKLIENKRTIKRISEFTGNCDDNIQWECAICNHKWWAVLHSVIMKGAGCSSCRKWTKTKVNLLLSKNNRKCELLDEIKSSTREKLRFKCFDCNKIWVASVYLVCGFGIHATGCPPCMNGLYYTKNIINDLLLNDNRGLILLTSTHKNTKDNGTFECKICNHKFIQRISKVTSEQAGCPACSKINHSKLWNDILDKKLIEFGAKIKRIEDYNTSLIKIKFECIDCGNILARVPNSIISQGIISCTKCDGHARLDNASFDQKLKEINPNIIRLDNYVNITDPIKFKCLIDNYVWPASPRSLLESGLCQKCGGFKTNEKLILNYLIDNKIEHQYQFKIPTTINKFKYLRLDFYLPKANCVIEYNGLQHYMPVKFRPDVTDEESDELFKKQLIRDGYVKNYCNSKNIELISIDWREYKGKRLIKYLDSISVALK